MKRLIDFSKHTSLKIGAEVEVEILASPLEKTEKVIIGGGNNLLISPRASNLVMLGREFDYLEDLGDLIEVGGAVSSGRIYNFFKKCNLGGLEFLRGLPGRLGGLVRMNAGMKSYEMKDILHSVWIDGEWQEAKDLSLSYRDSGIRGIIYGARFYKQEGFREQLVPEFEKMRETHPHLPSCGSCFKNPQGDFAGRLLESVGLKGYQIGGVGLSEKHANFLVNLGGGKFEEALELIALAQKRVWEEYGIKLEKEVVVVE